MSDNFFKSSVFLFSGLMAGNFFNYLFQVTMGRLLSVKIYGEVNALLSLMVIFSVPFASITNYLAKNVSHLTALGHNKKANTLIVKSYKNVIGTGLVVIILGAIFSPYLTNHLKFDSVVPLLLLLLIVFFSTILPINIGVLQGLHSFKALSLISGASGLFRYILCVLAVIIGFGLNGVMAGAAFATLLAGYVSFSPIKKHLELGWESIMPKETDAISYILPILIVNMSFAILAQADIVLVKRFFTPHEAGIYSAAAIIGKAVMYLPGALVFALFPMVSANKARGKGTLSLLIKALGTTLFLSGTGAAVLYFAPGMIISALFGEKFLPSASIVGFFGLAMLPMAVLLILMNYNLAKGNRLFAYVMLLCSIAQVIGISYWHDNLITILKIIFYMGLACVTSQFLLLAFEYYKDRLYVFATSLISKK